MTVVAIDGPAGSGKSTVAAALARRLELAHVDTGAYYRAAALVVLRSGVDVRDPQACLRVVRDASIHRADGRTWVDGKDVEGEIRGPEVTAVVSAVSSHPQVRDALLALQREGIGDRGAVVEGRDAGTVVVPDADLKIWLTASPEERGRRRAMQLGRDDPDAIAAHAADIARRDAADIEQMHRARDAVEVDTTECEVNEIVEDIVTILISILDQRP